MRIFFPNGTIHYPPQSGPEAHKYQLVRQLTEMGHEFVTLRPDQNPLSDIRPKRPIAVLRAIRWADAIYLRTTESPDSASKLTSPSRRWAIPRRCAVIWEQNQALTVSLRVKQRSPERIAADIRVCRRLATRVDAAIGVTRQVSQQLDELLGIRSVCTIQNASDPELFRPDAPRPEGLALDAGKLHVSWIGSTANSNHDSELVEGLARVIDERDWPIEVHVIGKTESLFATPRPRSLRLYGPVSYLELPGYLAAMDVGLALYKTPIDGQSPLKLFDYMASGCIPVCSPGQPVEEVLDGAGAGLVDRFTPVTLAEALIELHRDPERRRAMAAAGRRKIEDEYNWRRVAERVERVITEAVERRRGTGSGPGSSTAGPGH